MSQGYVYGFRADQWQRAIADSTFVSGTWVGGVDIKSVPSEHETRRRHMEHTSPGMASVSLSSNSGAGPTRIIEDRKNERKKKSQDRWKKKSLDRIERVRSSPGVSTQTFHQIKLERGLISGVIKNRSEVEK